MKVFKKLTSLFLATLLVLSALVAVPFTASAATLTAVEPDATWGVTTGVSEDGNTYYIADKYDLQAFNANSVANGQYANKTVVLTADIDMTGMLWESANIDFRGTFDGQGHTISNFTASRTALNYGFFDYLDNATVKNVLFVDANITNTASTACTAILTRATTNTVSIENVYVSGVITATGNNVGAFASYLGAKSNVTLENCVSNVKIINSTRAGGFIGQPNAQNDSATVKDCQNYTVAFNDCAFIGDLSAAGSFSGGFIGYHNDYGSYTFNRCVSIGKLPSTNAAFVYCINAITNSTADKATQAGGIVINDCYTTAANNNVAPIRMLASQAATHVSTLKTNGNAVVTVPYGTNFETGKITVGGNEVVALTAFNDAFATAGGYMAKGASATWTAETFATTYSTLANNGWVATGNTVTFGDNMTVPEIMPATVAAMIGDAMTVSYWQVKEGTTNDFRFVAKLNFDALAAYDKVGYEVTVKLGDNVLVNAEQVSTDTVLTSITANNETLTAADLQAKYLVALSINGFKAADTTYEVTITPFVQCGTTIIRDYDETVTGTITGNEFDLAD